MAHRHCYGTLTHTHDAVKWLTDDFNKNYKGLDAATADG